MPIKSPTTIDPSVQAQLNYGEATLAEFMDGLSKTISRYNTLLAKALPQNPKAHFYYYKEEGAEEAGKKEDGEKKEEGEKKEGDAAAPATATATPAAAAATDAASSEEKKAKTEDGTAAAAPAAAPTAAAAAAAAKPTSPLLRRPQLQKEELAQIKKEAKKELMKRQTSVSEFPVVGEDGEEKKEGEEKEEAKEIKAHTKKAHDKKHAAKKGHDHHVGDKKKKHHEAEKDEEKGATEEKPDEKKKKKKASKKSILPNLFGEKKDEKKKKEEAKKEGEEGEKKDEEPAVVVTAEQAAADADEWEDEDEDEEGEEGEEEAELTVEELFAKIAPSPQLLQEIRVLKNEARELNEKFEIIHDWIAMNIPALATEDAEGTQVMAAIIDSLDSFMGTTTELYSSEAEYLSERAALELSFLQNPEIATGLALIAIHDNDAWDSVEAGYRALIRCYLIAHSQLAKNMEQIRAPVRRRVNLSM